MNFKRRLIDLRVCLPEILTYYYPHRIFDIVYFVLTLFVCVLQILGFLLFHFPKNTNSVSSYQPYLIAKTTVSRNAKCP